MRRRDSYVLSAYNKLSTTARGGAHQILQGLSRALLADRPYASTSSEIRCIPRTCLLRCTPRTLRLAGLKVRSSLCCVHDVTEMRS